MYIHINGTSMELHQSPTNSFKDRIAAYFRTPPRNH
jgi:hypothetical protein